MGTDEHMVNKNKIKRGGRTLGKVGGQRVGGTVPSTNIVPLIILFVIM